MSLASCRFLAGWVGAGVPADPSRGRPGWGGAACTCPLSPFAAGQARRHTCPTGRARRAARPRSATAPPRPTACWWPWAGDTARPTHGSCHGGDGGRGQPSPSPAPCLPLGLPSGSGQCPAQAGQPPTPPALHSAGPTFRGRAHPCAVLERSGCVCRGPVQKDRHRAPGCEQPGEDGPWAVTVRQGQGWPHCAGPHRAAMQAGRTPGPGSIS